MVDVSNLHDSWNQCSVAMVWCLVCYGWFEPYWNQSVYLYVKDCCSFSMLLYMDEQKKWCCEWHSKLREKKDDIRLVIDRGGGMSASHFVPDTHLIQWSVHCAKCSYVRAILPTLQSRHQFPSLHDIIFSRDDTVSHPLNRSTSKVFHLISIACSVYWALGLGWCCARGGLSRHAWMLCLPCCQTASMICNLPLFILGCLTLSLANIICWVWASTHIISDLQLVHEAPAFEFQATLYFVTNWLRFPNQEKDMFKPVCYSRPNQSCPLYKRSQWRVSSVVHHDE